MDEVLTVTDYYDGPRAGLCTFGGAWHAYRSEWDDATEDFPEGFQLAPVPDDVARAMLEAWAVWRRWEAAFHAGTTTEDSHPALPEDKQRSEELEAIIDQFLAKTDWPVTRRMKVQKWLQSPFQSKAGPIAAVEWVA